jgi:hypothetical protein
MMIVKSSVGKEDNFSGRIIVPVRSINTVTTMTAELYNTTKNNNDTGDEPSCNQDSDMVQDLLYGDNITTKATTTIHPLVLTNTTDGCSTIKRTIVNVHPFSVNTSTDSTTDLIGINNNEAISTMTNSMDNSITNQQK